MLGRNLDAIGRLGHRWRVTNLVGIRERPNRTESGQARGITSLAILRVNLFKVGITDIWCKEDRHGWLLLCTSSHMHEVFLKRDIVRAGSRNIDQASIGDGL